MNGRLIPAGRFACVGSAIAADAPRSRSSNQMSCPSSPVVAFDRAAGGELRVGGAAEAHPAVPLDPDADVLLVRGDADDLQRAGAATRSQRERLEAGVTGMVEHRERKRVLDQERLRLAGCQERQPEAFA